MLHFLLAEPPSKTIGRNQVDDGRRKSSLGERKNAQDKSFQAESVPNLCEGCKSEQKNWMEDGPQVEPMAMAGDPG